MTGRWRWVPVVLTVVLSVAYLYVGTRPTVPRLLRTLPDVAAHAAGYGVLGFAATLTARVLTLSRPVIAGAAFATAHGAALEGIQAMVPRRRAQWRDLLADALGGWAGALLASRAMKRWRGEP